MKVSLRDRVAARMERVKSPEWRKKRREELIRVVKAGITDVGNALKELRDDEHWKDTHTNFAEFCRDNFEISKSHLYRVLKGVEIIGLLPKDIRSKITNETQTMALVKIPESKRVDAILKAEKNGGITAENLLSHSTKTNVTNKVTSPSEKSQVGTPPSTVKTGSETVSPAIREKTLKVHQYDEIGTPIPDDALPFWKRKQEVQDLLTQLSKIKCLIEKSRATEDPMYSSVSQSAIDHLGMSYHAVKEAMPFAVCTVCQGHVSLQPKGCSNCRNRGLVSENHWLQYSPIEIKEMRVRSNAEHAKKVGREMPEVRMYPAGSPMGEKYKQEHQCS